MGERNTAVLLEQWGIWLKQDSGFNLGARSAMQMIMQLGEGEVCCMQANITDDDALEVDQAMAKLKIHRPEYFRVMWLLYVCDYSAVAVGKAIGISDREVGKLNSAGTAFVDVLLNSELFLNAA